MPTIRSYLTRAGTAALFSLAMAQPAPLPAQVPPDSARARACIKALRLVARATRGEQYADDGDRTPPGRRLDRAWSLLPRCGPAGGPAAGAAWRGLRNVGDTAQLLAMYSRVWSFKDASVFDAAATVAADQTATPQSRVYSVMLLMAQLFDDWDADYRQFIAATGTRICLFGPVYDRMIVMGSPLPIDARTRARTLAQRLAGNTRAPAAVRSAGRCLDQAISAAERLEAAEPIRPPGL